VYWTPARLSALRIEIMDYRLNDFPRHQGDKWGITGLSDFH
jgi:hypothetical protein